MLEFVFGFILAIVSSYVVLHFVNKISSENKMKTLRISMTQSNKYAMLAKHLLIPTNDKEKKDRQSSKLLNKIQVRVIITKDKAYWIQDNKFLVADLSDDGIDQESTKEVDVMSMDKVQLDEIMFIVEKLTEGKKQ